MNRHNSTNQIRNFIRNPCRVICDIFAWFWCVVCGPYIFISKTINYILNFLTSNIFAWIWCVVRGPYIFISKTINYNLNFLTSRIEGYESGSGIAGATIVADLLQEGINDHSPLALAALRHTSTWLSAIFNRISCVVRDPSTCIINFFRNFSISAIFNRISCVVRDSSTCIINFFRNFLISDIFAWFWCVVCGSYIFISKTINYILNLISGIVGYESGSGIAGATIVADSLQEGITDHSPLALAALRHTSTWRRVSGMRKRRRSVKVHVLVAGETFRTHETFIQKLKLQIELCSAESSNVILVFCPVVSRIGTDMEAAMARVTGNKPVILVFMHHCHKPSHMTNTTVQPSRSNIVQVVHCAFLENAGLLQCQENEQAVSDVRMMLQKY